MHEERHVKNLVAALTLTVKASEVRLPWDTAFLRPKIQRSRIRLVLYAVKLAVMNDETCRAIPQ